MRLFYLIWVDFILKFRSQPANKNNWQFMTFAYMTVVMSLDFFFIITYLESLLGYYFYDLKIPIIPQKIGDPLSFVILFVGPPLLLNYMLIFRNQRYKKLISKYKLLHFCLHGYDGYNNHCAKHEYLMKYLILMMKYLMVLL